eukprot:2998856-Pleurochrysis_carterae.AAC.1
MAPECFRADSLAASTVNISCQHDGYCYVRKVHLCTSAAPALISASRVAVGSAAALTLRQILRSCDCRRTRRAVPIGSRLERAGAKLCIS